ncbi:MAG: glycosyltransferase family 1 protein [Candidatus Daviesbacteria bacterium]|nr:glycosyltransferase family 1 protein [Candidatus Daviesbacteria bacterium]
MNIWIDGYEANVPQRLGSSQLGFELLCHLEKIDQKNEYTILLPSAPLPDLPKERAGWTYKILKPNKLWTRIALPYALYSAKIKPDLIYSPTHYIPRFSPVRRIVTIFDLSYLHFPEMIPRADLWKMVNWGKFGIQRADHIITISNFSRKDIIKNYKINSEKVTAIYPGYDKNIFKPIKDHKKIDLIKQKYGISGKYIIYIGTIQPRKNLIRLIEAFKPIENLKLVIVGKTKGLGREGWMFDEILAKPAKLGIEDKVIFTGFVPTEELPYLLSEAETFILPSLWEGFGIPAVEAMACGAPVIVSNVSSLPEVVGNAGLLIDPHSTTQIEQAIRTITTDSKIREKRIKAGLEQAKKYSWNKMAKTLLKVFELTCAEASASERKK